MTIQEALDRVDTLKPNAQERRLKIAWLSELDGLIDQEIIRKHEPAEGEEEPEAYAGYDEDSDPGTVLTAPFPYDELYTYWLMSKVDLQNQETDKYNNDRTLFNNAYDMFHDWWRRGHMPKTRVRELMI